MKIFRTISEAPQAFVALCAKKATDAAFAVAMIHRELANTLRSVVQFGFGFLANGTQTVLGLVHSLVFVAGDPVAESQDAIMVCLKPSLGGGQIATANVVAATTAKAVVPQAVFAVVPAELFQWHCAVTDATGLSCVCCAIAKVEKTVVDGRIAPHWNSCCSSAGAGSLARCLPASLDIIAAA